MYKIIIDESIFEILPLQRSRYEVYELEGNSIGTIWPVLGKTTIEWLCDSESLQCMLDKIGNAIELIERRNSPD